MRSSARLVTKSRSLLAAMPCVIGSHATTSAMLPGRACAHSPRRPSTRHCYQRCRFRQHSRRSDDAETERILLRLPGLPWAASSIAAGSGHTAYAFAAGGGARARAPA